MAACNMDETSEAKFCFFMRVVKYKLVVTVVKRRCADLSFLCKKGQEFVYEFLNLNSFCLRADGDAFYTSRSFASQTESRFISLRFLENKVTRS